MTAIPAAWFPRGRGGRAAPGDPRRGGVSRLARLASAALIVALVSTAPATPLGSGLVAPARGADGDTVRILLGAAGDIDPAAQGDIGSAAVSAQLYESL